MNFRSRFICTAATACALLSATGTVHAVSICVSTAAELQQALTDSSTGGMYAGQDVEIDLNAGTYKTGAVTGNGPFHYSSTAAAGQMILAGGWMNNCSTFTRSASVTRLDGNNATQVLKIDNPHGTVFITYLTVQNGDSTVKGGGMAINASIAGGAAAYLYNNIIRDNHTTKTGGGFVLYGSGNNQVGILDNVIYGNSADQNYGAGVVSSRSSNQAFVTQNTISLNTTSTAGASGGLSCCGTPTLSPEITNNISWQNTNFGFDFSGTAPVLYNNDYGTRTGVAPQQDLNRLSVSPAFVDSANGNFRLSGASPLFGKGTTQFGTFSYDLEGSAYPSDGTIDIGAYEDTVFNDGFDGN